MPMFEYLCPKGHLTVAIRAIKHRDDALVCHCGLPARKKLSPVNWTFGWRLSDNYLNIKGYPHELVRNI